MVTKMTKEKLCTGFPNKLDDSCKRLLEGGSFKGHRLAGAGTRQFAELNSQIPEM